MDYLSSAEIAKKWNVSQRRVAVFCKEGRVKGAVLTVSYTHLDVYKRQNLNTASKEQLMTLSGIGESKAETIISYREKNGAFQTIEDLSLIHI